MAREPTHGNCIEVIHHLLQRRAIPSPIAAIFYKEYHSHKKIQLQTFLGKANAIKVDGHIFWF